MSKLLITTQVYENYAWDADGNLGTGANAHWKAKGGSDYVVKNVDECDMVLDIVYRASRLIEFDNDACREEVIGWKIVADDYLTDFERSQLEYDGKIMFPARVIEMETV